MERLKYFFKDDSGASAVEYALLVALIGVGLVGAMTNLKNAISSAFNAAATALNAASQGAA
ncbi:MAG: Flp family type IVb pilin [Desulfobaccales bacterium]